VIPARSRPLLVLVLTAGCATPWVVPRAPGATEARATTRDGYVVSMARRRPPGTPTGRPVLLVHGISANDRNMDLHEGLSLAAWFATHGRDAWSLSLRGTGSSQRREGREPYAFDAFWREDLPAAIARIRAETGAEKVDVVAHSLGGMALYAYLSQGGEGVGAAVTLGSPTRLDFGGEVTRLVPLVRPVFPPRGGTLPAVLMAHAIMPLHGEIDRDPFLLLCANPENVPATTWKRLIANGIADVESEVILQLGDLLEFGRFTSADGKIDFRADMSRIRVPILVVAGKLDRLGSPMAARDGFRALGGPKAWRLYGVETGTRADYGHMDLIMGQYAEQEVWPDLLEFLRRHADSV